MLSFPYESREKLLEGIKNGEINNIKEALEFEKEENLWFGPYSDIFDFLKIEDYLGVIQFNNESFKNVERTIAYVEPQVK